MIVRIENGKVADIYDGLDEATIDHLKSAFSDSEFIETEETVNRGDNWPKVEITTPELPQPQPKTRDMVVMELNAISDQKKREYLQRWPSTSQNDLWPLFSAEVVRLSEGVPVTAQNYPVLSGALSARLGIPAESVPSEAIEEYTQAIVGAKAAHAQELTKIEQAYQNTLGVFLEKGSVDVRTVFEGLYHGS